MSAKDKASAKRPPQKTTVTNQIDYEAGGLVIGSATTGDGEKAVVRVVEYTDPGIAPPERRCVVEFSGKQLVADSVLTPEEFAYEEGYEAGLRSRRSPDDVFAAFEFDLPELRRMAELFATSVAIAEATQPPPQK